MGVGGRNRLIDSPETFEKLAIEYMQWVKDNPVMKTITASFQGEISYLKVPHIRGATQFGLASHMGIGLRTLQDYGARPEFSHIYDNVMTKIKAWNADLALSGEINPSLVARLDGHTDKQEVANTVTIGKDLNDFYSDIKSES